MTRFANREEYEAWKRGEATPQPPAATVSSGGEAPAVAAAPKPKQGFKETFSGLPPWAWVFIVGCIALPIVNLGGAIPTGLRFGGAAGCANVAKRNDWELAPRVLVCGLITAGIWVLFLGFAVALVSLQK